MDLAPEKVLFSGTFFNAPKKGTLVSPPKVVCPPCPFLASFWGQGTGTVQYSTKVDTQSRHGFFPAPPGP